MSPTEYRTWLAKRLIRARGARSVHSCDESGVGYQVIARLEAAGNETVDLSTLYLLALYLGVNLPKLLTTGARGVGTWPDGDVPSWPAVDMAVRKQFRQTRQTAQMGARKLSSLSGHARVSPSWIFRIESGEVAHLDVVRLQSVAEVLGSSVPRLLPPALWMREDDDNTRDRDQPHPGTPDATMERSPTP